MKDRIAAILNEKKTNPTAYKRDGWMYFEEFLPFIQAQLKAQVEVKKIEKKYEAPKPAPKPEVKKPSSKPPRRKWR
jgi:hypothetical protein